MNPRLSEGAIDEMMAGGSPDRPILQLLGYKKVPSGANVNTERYRLVVSDGKQSHTFAMLATQLNGLITSGELELYTVVRLEKYICNKVQTDKRVLIILDLTVMMSGAAVGGKIGNPVLVGQSTGSSAAEKGPNANGKFNSPRKKLSRHRLNASAVDISTSPKHLAKAGYQHSKDSYLNSGIFCGLTADQHWNILQIVYIYQHCFTQPGKPLGRTSEVRHAINTGNRQPVKEPLYCLTDSKELLLETLIQKMINADFISQVSENVWGFPIATVRKNGHWRFFIDFRLLNRVTKPDLTFSRDTDDVFNAAHQSNYISILDFASGVYQIEIEEEDRIKTTFITHKEAYCFKVVPFGLMNTSSTFRKLINSVLADIKSHICFDDQDCVIVHSQSFEEHLKHLHSIFQRLEKVNLQLKASRCLLAYDHIRCCGLIVSKNKVKLDQDIVRNLIEFPVPEDQHQLNKFIGSYSYYSKFFGNFEVTAKPLLKLLKKKNFYWTDTHQKAFDKLRSQLAYPTFLSKFD